MSNTNPRRTNIFFAIPCGEFFSIQSQTIKAVCDKANINAVVVENHTATEGLWKKITDQIDSSDYFFADITAKSPNIMLELGYAIREKRSKYYGIFIADNREVLVDLQGFVLQKYVSTRDFKKKLIAWILDNIPFVESKGLTSLQDQETRIEVFEDYFKDNDRFLKMWVFPPQSSFLLTGEGLRFTNAHFPIMTNFLALLQNYEFEFKAKIESARIGWIVKGTRPFNAYLPTFCIMFNIDKDGVLTPHIFNYNNVDPQTNYTPFTNNRANAALSISKEGWFTITTRVNGDKVTVLNDNTIIFEGDFAADPYKVLYDFPNKQGEIGFRCYPGEQALINYVKVREIETCAEKTSDNTSTNGGLKT